MTTGRVTVPVLGSPIDALTWDTATERLLAWSAARQSRYVCICNAHVVVTAAQDPGFQHVIAGADMCTPDGAPVAWMMRRLGHPRQQRLSGPDLMQQLCERAAQSGQAIALLGGTPQTLERLQSALHQRWPALVVAAALSPPFRPLSAEEDEAIVQALNRSGAGLLFVGLGCPKQERWMAEHRGRVQAVMLGVGAAFDFHAGTVRRAPPWMQRSGLEWLHRLLSEPRRLWRRYLFTNTAFVIGALRQLLRSRSTPPG